MTTETKRDIYDVKNLPMRFLYSVFLAALVALFFGLGISAFYPAPKAPNYPYEMAKPTSVDGTIDAEMIKLQEKYDKDQQVYMAKEKVYSRNVSMITLALAVMTLVISLTLLENFTLFSDGFLLGGILTLGYSIIRGVMSEDARYRFVVVTVGLVITLALGYIKFLRVKKEV